jgi:hypothetical protein
MAQSKTGVKKIRTESGVVLSKSTRPQVCLYLFKFSSISSMLTFLSRRERCTKIGRRKQEEKLHYLALVTKLMIVLDQTSSPPSHILLSTLINSHTLPISLLFFLRFNSNAPRELRNVHEIRKLHDKKNDSKLKNMKKGKRKVIESKMRKLKGEERKNGYLGTKAGNRKVKAVFRR